MWCQSVCFKGSQTSCTEIICCVFLPRFGRKISHHVMDACCWVPLHEKRVRRTAKMKQDCAPLCAAPWRTLWAATVEVAVPPKKEGVALTCFIIFHGTLFHTDVCHKRTGNLLSLLSYCQKVCLHVHSLQPEWLTCKPWDTLAVLERTPTRKRIPHLAVYEC